MEQVEAPGPMFVRSGAGGLGEPRTLFAQSRQLPSGQVGRNDAVSQDLNQVDLPVVEPRRPEPSLIDCSVMCPIEGQNK
ncbi:MAG: hypothetical protein EP343_25075 [Deltaproteobacteria bacterium]|nr:MAG: hypothetical protein EP343_25075 [Deltaproteobacteria bacterium]